MRLLYVIPEYPPQSGGGIMTFYANLLPQLARMGHDVTVLVANPSSNAYPPYSADGVRIEFVDTMRINEIVRKLPRFAAVPGLQKHLATAWAAWDHLEDRDGFDVVEATDWGLLFVPWILSRPGMPVVVQAHGSVGQIAAAEPEPGRELDELLTQLIEQNILRDADDVQTYSESNARAWLSRLDREVICIRPAWSRRSDGLPPSGEASARGIVVARIQEWKGVVVLCSALRRLGSRAPILEWVGRDTKLLSEGRSTSAFLAENYADVWGKCLLPIGGRTASDTHELQRRAAFAVVPSTWDVFNFTVVEAMGAGRPVICSDSAGAAELIDDGVTGLLFPSGADAALADALLTMAAMPEEKRRQMGLRGREAIESKLSPDAVAADRVRRYEWLRAQPRQSRCSSLLDEALRPGAPGDNDLAFLDQLPLRKLARYVGERAMRKIR